MSVHDLNALDVHLIPETSLNASAAIFCVSHNVVAIVGRYLQWHQVSVCIWALVLYASVLRFRYVRALVELQVSNAVTGCRKGFECSLVVDRY